MKSRNGRRWDALDDPGHDEACPCYDAKKCNQEMRGAYARLRRALDKKERIGAWAPEGCSPPLTHRSDRRSNLLSKTQRRRR